MVVDKDGRVVDMRVVFVGGMEGVYPIGQAIVLQADLMAKKGGTFSLSVSTSVGTSDGDR